MMMLCCHNSLVGVTTAQKRNGSLTAVYEKAGPFAGEGKTHLPLTPLCIPAAVGREGKAWENSGAGSRQQKQQLHLCPEPELVVRHRNRVHHTSLLPHPSSGRLLLVCVEHGGRVGVWARHEGGEIGGRQPWDYISSFDLAPPERVLKAVVAVGEKRGIKFAFIDESGGVWRRKVTIQLPSPAPMTIIRRPRASPPRTKARVTVGLLSQLCGHHASQLLSGGPAGAWLISGHSDSGDAVITFAHYESGRCDTMPVSHACEAAGDGACFAASDSGNLLVMGKDFTAVSLRRCVRGLVATRLCRLSRHARDGSWSTSLETWPVAFAVKGWCAVVSCEAHCSVYSLLTGELLHMLCYPDSLQCRKGGPLHIWEDGAGFLIGLGDFWTGDEVIAEGMGIPSDACDSEKPSSVLQQVFLPVRPCDITRMSIIEGSKPNLSDLAKSVENAGLVAPVDPSQVAGLLLQLARVSGASWELLNQFAHRLRMGGASGTCIAGIGDGTDAGDVEGWDLATAVAAVGSGEEKRQCLEDALAQAGAARGRMRRGWGGGRDLLGLRLGLGQVPLLAALLHGLLKERPEEDMRLTPRIPISPSLALADGASLAVESVLLWPQAGWYRSPFLDLVARDSLDPSLLFLCASAPEGSCGALEAACRHLHRCAPSELPRFTHGVVKYLHMFRPGSQSDSESNVVGYEAQNISTNFPGTVYFDRIIASLEASDREVASDQAKAKVALMVGAGRFVAAARWLSERGDREGVLLLLKHAQMLLETEQYECRWKDCMHRNIDP
ncbi:unnamed protein product [Chrysoparadoxa australica]